MIFYSRNICTVKMLSTGIIIAEREREREREREWLEYN